MVNATGNYIDGTIWDQDDANWVAGFGDGSDGAFSQTGAGTTNLTQGTIYQYTTFNLGAAHTISASSTSDKPIIILVQGNCTIDGTISLVGKGCPTNFAGYADTGINSSDQRIGFGTRAGLGANAQSKAQVGIKGMLSWNFQNNQAGFIMNGTAGATGGLDGSNLYGGGGGASSSNHGGTGESRAEAGSSGSGDGGGGAGGCTILIIVGGNLTFGAASVINTSGAAGGSAGRTGGGGGGAGDILIFYRGTLTDGGVTKTVAGGAAGLDTTDGDTDGGAGAAGYSVVAAYDTILWGRGT